MEFQEPNEKNSNFLSDSISNLSSFDKNYFLATTGILTFSIAFIKDIVNLKNSAPLILLILSWILIAIAIGITLFSFHKLGHSNKNVSISIAKYYSLFTNLKNFQNISDKEVEDLENSRKVFTDASFATAEKFNNKQSQYRKNSMLFFLFGLALLLIFVSWSLTCEKASDKDLSTSNKDSLTNSLRITIKPDTLILKSPDNKDATPEIIQDIKPYILQNVFFDFDRSILRPESFRELDSLKNILNNNPNKKVEICAHTDNKGSDSYNQLLSQKRALAVKNYLVSKGILNQRIIVKGYGAKVPIASNKTEEGRSRNRRTEFMLLD